MSTAATITTAGRLREIEAEKAERAEQIAAIRRALGLLVEPGGVVEIRAVDCPMEYGKPATVAGWFDDLDKAAAAVAKLDARKPAGIYYTLNRIHPGLLARSPNQLTDRQEPTTSDNDVNSRRWALLDFDATRPADISSTEDEHAAAEDTGRECVAWLSSQGWPAPILADSGNGFHALYRIDIEAKDDGLIKRVLEAIANRFDNDTVKIDRAVFNPARISKLYGTHVRKGHSTADRPHRLAQLVEVPDHLDVVPVEKLQALAASVQQVAQPAKPSANSNSNGHFDSRLDVPKWLNSRGVRFTVKARPDSLGRTVYKLQQCPFDSSHGTSGEVAIYQAPDGKLAAGCMHSSCSGRGWQEFKTAIGPPAADDWDPPLSAKATLRQAPTKAPATIAVNTWVITPDRGNRGQVTADLGDNCRVHLVNPETGAAADVEFSKSELRTLDGQPLAPPAEPIPVAISLRELVAANPALRPAVIDGLLRQGETMNMVAAPKRGKSWLANSLGLAVVSGCSWLDTFTCTTGRVLIIDAELHPEVIAHRLPAVANAMGLGPECLDLIDVLALRGRGFDLLKMGPFIESIEPGRYAMVIFDAWYRFLPVGFSENDNAQVMALYNQIDAYTSRLKAAWVNIHHASKGDQSGKGTTDVGSGAGSQSRAADTHLIIRQHEQDDVAVIEAVVRSWPPVQPIAIRWQFPIWQLDTADPRKLQRPRERTSRENRDIHLNEDRQTIVNAMVATPGPQTKTFIRDTARIGNPRFGYAWASLMMDGTISIAGDVQKGNNRSYEGFVLAERAEL